MIEKDKNIIVVAAFLACAVAGGSFYYKSFFAKDTIAKAQKQVTKLNDEISKLESERKKFQSWVDRIDELQAREVEINKVLKRLPDSPDAPAFFGALVTALRGTGIIQESIRAETPRASSQYTEIPYSAKAYGRYHEVGQFLSLIEQNPDRFMRVKNLNVSNNLARPSIHPITLQIATFTFNKAGMHKEGEAGDAVTKAGAKR